MKELPGTQDPYLWESRVVFRGFIYGRLIIVGRRGLGFLGPQSLQCQEVQLP